MQVYFQRMAFLDGVRYRQGMQNYVGDFKFLPSDAVVDGKKVKDLKKADLDRAAKAQSKDEVKDLKEEQKLADEHRLDIVDGSGNKVGEVNEAQVGAELVAQQREPTPPPQSTVTPTGSVPTPQPQSVTKETSKPAESDVKTTDTKVVETEPKPAKEPTVKSLDPFSGPAPKK